MTHTHYRTSLETSTRISSPAARKSASGWPCGSEWRWVEVVGGVTGYRREVGVLGVLGVQLTRRQFVKKLVVVVIVAIATAVAVAVAVVVLKSRHFLPPVTAFMSIMRRWALVGWCFGGTDVCWCGRWRGSGKVTNAHPYTHAQTYAYTCMHTHMHTYTRIHIHTHTLTYNSINTRWHTTIL